MFAPPTMGGGGGGHSGGHVNILTFNKFSSPELKAQVSFSARLSFVRTSIRLSVKFSHFQCLLQSNFSWKKICNKTKQKQKKRNIKKERKSNMLCICLIFMLKHAFMMWINMIFSHNFHLNLWKMLWPRLWSECICRM